MELRVPGEYLKKEDLDQKNDTILTITGGQIEELGPDKEKRPVLTFEETDQKLVCNKINAGRILSAHNTTDTDKLKGKKIAIYVDHEVDFGGKVVGGIRVRAQAPDEEVPF